MLGARTRQWPSPPSAATNGEFWVDDRAQRQSAVFDDYKSTIGARKSLAAIVRSRRHVRRAVARECERFVQRHIEVGHSFAVETTLRTKAAIEQAQLARARGFATEMIFVAPASIDENIARILQRAQGGGHGASESEVRSIHAASLANMGAAIDAFERVDIYDSNAPWSTPMLVATSLKSAPVNSGSGPGTLAPQLRYGCVAIVVGERKADTESIPRWSMAQREITTRSPVARSTAKIAPSSALATNAT